MFGQGHRCRWAVALLMAAVGCSSEGDDGGTGGGGVGATAGTGGAGGLGGSGGGPPATCEGRVPEPCREPTTTHGDALFAERCQYQVEIYDWLASLTTADVELTPAELTWDDTYGSTDELAELAVELGSSSVYLVPSFAVRGAARWFVLDDAAGGGIEGSGAVLQPRFANDAAYWYQRSVPLAGGGQGNPYYGAPALARRALVSAAVELLMLDGAHEQDQYRRADFLGGTLNNVAYAYQMAGSVVPETTQIAFEGGLEHMLDKLLAWGPHDINTNMDTRAIAAVARIYDAVCEGRTRDKATRAARRFLFGREDGELETNHDLDDGIFYPAGYVGENNGPETTYNGVSLFHLLEARAVLLEVDDWAFLDEPLGRMLDFKVHQYFVDPDGYTDGPSGYACRTGDSYVYDQRNRAWRDVFAADRYDRGAPLLTATGGARLASETEMVSRVQSGVSYQNNHGFGDAMTEAPAPWSEEHWPPDSPYHSAPGWYDRLMARLDADDPATVLPFERAGHTFSRAFGSPGAEEFWAYRGTAGAHSFGFFVEHVPRSWPYNSWASGSLQAFWSSHTGMLVVAKHDKSGADVQDNENTRVFAEVELWATDHVWGRTAAGVISSAVYYDYSSGGPTVTADLGATPPWVEVAAGFGIEGGGLLQTTHGVTSRFEAQGAALGVRKTITSDGGVDVEELWLTIPVLLRDQADNTQASLSETTIEHHDGGSWQPLSTTIVTSAALRLGRDFDDGQGPRYGYVQFDQPERIRLASEPWQADYQSDNLLRNVLIDLHGQPGQLQPLPTQRAVGYVIGLDPP